MRILFDKNVPVGVRRFLSQHHVSTFVETGLNVQLENGELLKAAERAGFDVLVTSDQNIRYQQNLTGRKLALIVLGSNIWPNREQSRMGNNKQSQQGNAGQLCLYRNAAATQATPERITVSISKLHCLYL